MQEAYTHLLGEEAHVGKVVEHIVNNRRATIINNNKSVENNKISKYSFCSLVVSR